MAARKYLYDIRCNIYIKSRSGIERRNLRALFNREMNTTKVVSVRCISIQFKIKSLFIMLSLGICIHLH